MLDLLKTYGAPATLPHIGGRYFGFVIRLSICSWATTEKDVSLSVQSFVEARKLAVGSA